MTDLGESGFATNECGCGQEATVLVAIPRSRVVRSRQRERAMWSNLITIVKCVTHPERTVYLVFYARSTAKVTVSSSNETFKNDTLYSQGRNDLFPKPAMFSVPRRYLPPLQVSVFLFKLCVN